MKGTAWSTNCSEAQNSFLKVFHLQRALRSKGTLLPLPARYFLVPPTKSLGFGNRPSSFHCHLGSLITIRSPLGPGVCEGEWFGLGDLAPLAVKVNILGSNMEWRREEPRERVVGGGGEGALNGGGGGAPLGDACPAARRVACAARDGVAPGGGGGGGGGTEPRDPGD